MRLDHLLVQLKKAISRSQAQQLIKEGCVSILRGAEWVVVTKPSSPVEASTGVNVEFPAERYVSRAGMKLKGALEHLKWHVNGLKALDIGQSTGGFTDCLLQNGVSRVVGVDVGHDQLASSLRGDPRVVCLQKINARELSIQPFSSLGVTPFDIAVMDVSFISQSLILPNILPLMSDRGRLLSLVKPQFEVGKQGVGKGGVVRDASLYKDVQVRLEEQIQQLGWHLHDFFPSSIEGGDGNKEFFLAASLKKA